MPPRPNRLHLLLRQVHDELCRYTPGDIYKVCGTHLVDVGLGADPAESFNLTPHAFGFQIQCVIYTNPKQLVKSEPGETLKNPFTPWANTAIPALLRRMVYFTPQATARLLLISAVHHMMTSE